MASRRSCCRANSAALQIGGDAHAGATFILTMSGRRRGLIAQQSQRLSISGHIRDILALWAELPSHERSLFPATSRCRRRDSNPRHADYDSAALTD
jgi:hypothetical protein